MNIMKTLSNNLVSKETKFFGKEYQSFMKAKNDMRARGCDRIVQHTSPSGIRSILGYKKETKPATDTFSVRPSGKKKMTPATATFSVRPSGESFNSHYLEQSEGKNGLYRIFRSETFDTNNKKITENHQSNHYEQKDEKWIQESFFKQIITFFKNGTIEKFSKNSNPKFTIFEYNYPNGATEKFSRRLEENFKYAFTAPNGTKSKWLELSPIEQKIHLSKESYFNN